MDGGASADDPSIVEEKRDGDGDGGSDGEAREGGDGMACRRRDDGAASTFAEEPTLKTVVVNDGNPFFFWLYFMAMVSAVALVFTAGTSITARDDSVIDEFLAMPAGVRQHFEAGKLMKVEVGSDRSPVKVFVRIAGGEAEDDETVLLLHGLGSSSFVYRKLLPLLAGKKLRAVAVDLPGAGLSDKYCPSSPSQSRQEAEEAEADQTGFFRDRIKAFKELFTEGLFGPPDEAAESEFVTKMKKSSTKESRSKAEALALGAGDLAEVLAQIVASLELAPVHLVMHDSGAEVGLAWASLNPDDVESITLMDSLPRSPSLPLRLFRLPLLGPAAARSDLALRWILGSCCFAATPATGAEDYGYLMRHNDGLRAMLATAAASNSSMEVAEWAEHENLKGTPKQILWASDWSKEWQQEGDQLAAQIPAASFHPHHGSRWPQEDGAVEISEKIADFVQGLPPSARRQELPEHIGRMFEEMANNGGDGHSHGELGHSHDHYQPDHSHGELSHGHEHEYYSRGHAYMDGRGQAHGQGHGGWVL